MADLITRKECDKCMTDRRREVEAEFGKVYSALDSKVSWKHFTWIISTILGLYVMISAAIWSDLKDVRASTDNTALSVNSIQTVLNQAEITK